MPAHRVIMSLKDWSELEVDNLKIALKAARKGQPLLVPSAKHQPVSLRKPDANLRYLDIAVVMGVLQQWGLNELLDKLLPTRAAEVAAADVVTALVVQRCVAPDSKLAAARWYCTTALPELQGVSPRSFNNTRLHRVLDDLETIEVPLQERLAGRIRVKGGAFGLLFLDCTDTWFTGQGPDLAHPRVTKGGMLRRRIGIALLCDQRGFPLRWATVAGNHHEAATMLSMIRQVADQPWAEQVPFVVDRAMGNGVTIGDLLSVGVRFITAVPASEIPSYSGNVPMGAFDHVQLGPGSRDDQVTLQALNQAALGAGFVKISERHHALDLGLVGKQAGDDAVVVDGPSRAVATLRVARRLQADFDGGLARTINELAARHNISDRQVRRTLKLLSLTAEVQMRIMAGEADRVGPGKLAELAARPPSTQAAGLDALVEQAGEGRPLRPTRELARLVESTPFEVRGVIIYCPDQFIEQRQAARLRHEKLKAFVDSINEKLRTGRSRRSRDSIVSAIGGEIKHHRLSSLYSVIIDSVQHEGREVLQAILTLDEAALQRSQQADGLTLIVTHPDVAGPPAQIVSSYFAKDKVEKDFQTIKSIIKLRPVRHRTDLKVRAHVTLCMLALLVERIIEQRTIEAGAPMTAKAVFELLSTCHLNRYLDEDTNLYNLTNPSTDQKKLLQNLLLSDLADDATVAESIQPR